MLEAEEPEIRDMTALEVNKTKENMTKDDGDGFTLTTMDIMSLQLMLMTMVEKEMAGCDLVLAFDHGFMDPDFLDGLIHLPHAKKVCRQQHKPSYYHLYSSICNNYAN